MFFLWGIAVLALFLWNCSGDDLETYPCDEGSETRSAVSAGGESDYSDIYFDEASGLWLRPAADDGNMGEECSLMLMGSGGLPEVPRPDHDLPPITPVDPPREMYLVTGYYLTIWPKSQDEIDMLSDMEDVIVSYHPLTSQPVPDAIVEALGLFVRPPASNFIKYRETIEGYVSSDGEELEPYVLNLPVLYALWPAVGVPYPDWMDYEITGEKKELIIIDPPVPPRPPGGGGNSSGSTGVVPKITFEVFDSTLNKYIPIPCVRVRIQTSKTKVEQGYTDRNGVYQCTLNYRRDVETPVITLMWEHKQFFISINEQVPQYTFNMNTGHNPVQSYNIKEQPHTTIFMAASYWFENAGEHGLSSSCGSSGKVRIYDHTRGESELNGRFFVNDRGKTRIHIYRGNRASHLIFCTTAHEMGHGSMFAHKGRSKFSDTGKMIKESWARFTGWYLTNLAYKGWGYTKSSDLGDNAQDWESTWDKKDRWYSPLFIDLFDDSNQRAKFKKDNPGDQGYVCFPDDIIKNVPVMTIQYLAFNSYALKSFKERASYFFGRDYTKAQFDQFMSVYDEYWPYD